MDPTEPHPRKAAYNHLPCLKKGSIKIPLQNTCTSNQVNTETLLVNKHDPTDDVNVSLLNESNFK